MADPGCWEGAEGITLLLPLRWPCRASCQGNATTESPAKVQPPEHPAKVMTPLGTLPR